jgi:hypothetical protein
VSLSDTRTSLYSDFFTDEQLQNPKQKNTEIKIDEIK